MKIHARTAATAGVACALLLWAAGAAAADDANDPFERQREAAEKRYEMAKESCERLQKDDQDRCEEKAQADYTREMESIRQSQPLNEMGSQPGHDMDGMGTGEDME